MIEKLRWIFSLAKDVLLASSTIKVQKHFARPSGPQCVLYRKAEKRRDP
jgi:hypothetical protein